MVGDCRVELDRREDELRFLTLLQRVLEDDLGRDPTVLDPLHALYLRRLQEYSSDHGRGLFGGSGGFRNGGGESQEAGQEPGIARDGGPGIVVTQLALWNPE